MFRHENVHDGKLVPRLLLVATAVASAALLLGSADAQSTTAGEWKVVQSVTVEGAWRAVVSEKKVGTGERGENFYQLAFSIAAYDGSTFREKFRSPRDGGPLTAVMKAHGAALWFPIQSAKIVGTATIEGKPALVLQSHEFAADCGLGTVTVFRLDGTTGTVKHLVTATNGCDLAAAIVRSGSGSEIRLSGPYYGPNAPRCCPTKPAATAALRYRHGTWTVTPNYFAISEP